MATEDIGATTKTLHYLARYVSNSSSAMIYCRGMLQDNVLSRSLCLGSENSKANIITNSPQLSSKQCHHEVERTVQFLGRQQTLKHHRQIHDDMSHCGALWKWRSGANVRYTSHWHEQYLASELSPFHVWSSALFVTWILRIRHSSCNPWILLQCWTDSLSVSMLLLHEWSAFWGLVVYSSTTVTNAFM